MKMLKENKEFLVTFFASLALFFILGESGVMYDDTLHTVAMTVISTTWSLALVLVPLLAALVIGYGGAAVYGKMKLKKPKALPLRAFSTGTVLYTWEDWHKDNKAEFPIRYFVTETVPDFLEGLRGKLKQLVYFVKSHTYKRYHMLDIRHKHYKYGWADMTHVMLAASFAALVSYVENEMEGVFLEAVPPGEPVFFIEYWENRVEVEQEIKSLYNWWKNEYDGEDDTEECQHMLHRLVEVRPYLWT